MPWPGYEPQSVELHLQLGTCIQVSLPTELPRPLQLILMLLCCFYSLVRRFIAQAWTNFVLFLSPWYFDASSPFKNFFLTDCFSFVLICSNPTLPSLSFPADGQMCEEIHPNVFLFKTDIHHLDDLLFTHYGERVSYREVSFYVVLASSSWVWLILSSRCALF